MTLKKIILLAAILLAPCSSRFTSFAETAKPNILYILADDLGYGDVHCLNPKRGKIPTPNLDKLAAQGMIFTDAHGTSSVCTPSRYSILTGRYNWRSWVQHGVLSPYGSAMTPPTRATVATLLRQQGYATACVGKWHLGWDWSNQGKPMSFKEPWEPESLKYRPMDFTKPIKGGPTAVGFDYFFGLDAPNFPPYCFIENDRTVGVPTLQWKAPKSNNPYRYPATPGMGLPDWRMEDILPGIIAKSCEFITTQAQAQKPFFLYFALTSPHTPLAVNKEWEGRSGLNLYADFVMETDAMVGRVLNALEKSGVADNTLVIFSSDNGCAQYIVPDLEKKGHFPSARFRGYKSDAWDGGHRVPFIVRWPGVVKPGSTCNQLACQMDLMATLAEITGATIPESAGEDSASLLPLLKGEDKPVRETLIHHSIYGYFAIREGNWKLLVCPGSGGWSKPNDADAKKRKLPAVQLYDMSTDEGEKKNIQAQHPEIVQRLKAKLEEIVADGRSTPGPKQKNDVHVDIFKKEK
jgi:arylsulfatase A